jgi:hypothetical protein
MPFTRFDAALTAIVGFLSLGLYWRTLAPGLLSSDSGEFQTLAYLLGNTHPTGYPVYLLLAKPFTWLPVADVAYRVNLFSAIAASLTVAGVYLVGRLLTGYRWLALVGALALMVSQTFWSQALIAEVYTSGAAALVAVLLALLIWSESGSQRALFAAGLFGGLSLGVHLTVGLFAPAAAVFLLIKARRSVDWFAALAGVLTGLALFLIAFFIVDWHDPAANYFNAVVHPSHSAWELEASELDNPLERMMFGLSMRQFSSLMFADPERVTVKQAEAYWDNLPDELSWVVIGLAALGLLVLLIRRFSVAILFILALGAHWAYTFNYTIWDIYVFYIPSYILLSLLAVGGMGGLVDAATRLGGPWFWRTGIETFITLSILVVGVWPVFASHSIAVVEGEAPFDFQAYNLRELHPTVTALVQALDQDAIVFTDWGMLYPLYYAAHIEQGRTDLVFIETFPHSETGGLAPSLLDYVAVHLPYHPIFFSEPISDITRAGYKFSPRRIGPIQLYQIQP